MTTQISVPVEGTQNMKIAEKETTVTAVRSGLKAAGRMLFVDNLRVFLTILVILLHLSITYGGEGSWYYKERPTTELAGIILSLFNIWNQFFFMGLFFLISGYFVPGSVDRKGGWRYFKDRLVRLGIPLVLFSLLLSPIIEWAKGIQEGYFTGNLGQFYVSYWRRGDIAPGPLWFVEILLVFSIVYVLGRAILSRLSSRQAMTNTAPVRRTLTHAQILLFIAVLVPLNFILRAFSPIGEEWNHIQLAFMPQYALMFAAGILAYRRDWLPDLPTAVSRIWSIIAIVAIITLPMIMVFGGAAENMEPYLGGLNAQSLLLSSWEAVYCMSMSILMLSIFRSRLDFQGSLGRFLSKNAYTVFIIHAPILVGLAWLLRGVSLYPLLKFTLVAPIVIGVCFLTSHYLVRRIPLADKVL
jgi:fucose 4-O-acetylase-like acetyltransferase